MERQIIIYRDIDGNQKKGYIEYDRENMLIKAASDDLVDFIGKTYFDLVVRLQIIRTVLTEDDL